MHLRSLLLACSVLFAASHCHRAASCGENWPEFRGPRGDGVAQKSDLPTTWSETENVAWKTPIHGKGWSSPVVWNDQIWVTTAPEDGKQMDAVCADLATGRIVHDLKLWDVAEPQFCHPMNSYATPTPAIEAGRVYVHFGTHGTACLDTGTGEKLWERHDLHCNHHRGAASSPIIAGELLILTFDGYDVQFVVALDKATGKTVWQKNREIDYGTDDGDAKKAYSTPQLIEVGGKKQIVSPSAGAIVAYAPLTGEELWRVRSGGMNASARPLFAHGLIYATTAAGGFQLFATRPDGKGDVTGTHVAWKTAKSVPTRSSPLLVDDMIFMVNDSGVAACASAKTGDSHWQERLEGAFSASPLYANGRVYLFGEGGESPVIAAKNEFELLATNRLESGFMASPAVAGDALILRTRTHLYRIEKAKK